MIAEIRGAMESDSSTHALESAGDQCAHAVFGLLVVAGRLNLHHVANELHHLVFALFAVAQAVFRVIDHSPTFDSGTVESSFLRDENDRDGTIHDGKTSGEDAAGYQRYFQDPSAPLPISPD